MIPDPLTVDAALGALRRKIVAAGLPIEITNHRAVGFRLDAPAGFDLPVGT